MPEWIVKYWAEWLFGIVAAVLMALYKRLARRIKEGQTKDKALDDGMRALLRDRIIQACDHFFDKGYVPVHTRENIQNMYDAYHGLGGDGIVTDMVSRVMRLPYKDETQANCTEKNDG